MNIRIELTDADAELVDGFARATGWLESRKITKEDWLSQKVDAWVKQQAVQGVVIGQTQSAREVYVGVVKEAMRQATVRFPVVADKLPAVGLQKL